MGGRGSRSKLPTSLVPVPPQNQPGTNPVSNPQIDPKDEPVDMSNASQAVRDAIGYPGEPMSIEEAMAGANPHFNDGNQYKINCQRCVWAYELRRRGYDVEALPNPDDGSDMLQYRNAKGGWPNVFEGEGTGQDRQKYMPSRGTIAAMEQQMNDWGEGSRAIVAVQWKSGGGHVFIAEKTKDGVRYVDPQTGREVNINGYIGQTIHKQTALLRTDDLKIPSDLLAKCVKKRGT